MIASTDSVGHRCRRVNRAMPWVMRSAAGSLLTLTAIEVPALNVRIALRRLAASLLPGSFDSARAIQLVSALLGGDSARRRDMVLAQLLPGRPTVVRNQHRPGAAGHDSQ